MNSIKDSRDVLALDQVDQTSTCRGCSNHNASEYLSILITPSGADSSSIKLTSSSVFKSQIRKVQSSAHDAIVSELTNSTPSTKASCVRASFHHRLCFGRVSGQACRFQRNVRVAAQSQLLFLATNPVFQKTSFRSRRADLQEHTAGISKPGLFLVWGTYRFLHSASVSMGLKLLVGVRPLGVRHQNPPFSPVLPRFVPPLDFSCQWFLLVTPIAKTLDLPMKKAARW